MMVLRKEDFAVMKVNWDSKVENLESIAGELNLGLDSFVFLDDSEVERQLVKERLPQVVVPDWPGKPEMLSAWFVDRVAYEHFPKYRLTQEDGDKTHQYARHAQRRQLASGSDARDFIDRLDIRVEYHVDCADRVDRASQLTQKTNQFNATTRRYSPADIRRFVESKVHRVVLLDYADRFGREGLTGLAIVDLERGEIDTFLLSCRIIGRGVEDRLLSTVEALAREAGCSSLFASFIPTATNAPARDFYARGGYSVIANSETGEVRYCKELS
jgi:FkbH-like protein